MVNTKGLSDYAAQQVKERPVEAKLVLRILRALDAAGMPVTEVYDGEERHRIFKVNTAPRWWHESAVLNHAMGLDEVWLSTASGATVYLVMGQHFECLTDYTTDLEDALAPVFAWIDRWDR